MIKTLRRSSRSTHTPAMGHKKKVGICPAKPTSPSKNAEPVKRYTSQLVARRLIQVPINEMLCPMKNKRKLRIPRILKLDLTSNLDHLIRGNVKELSSTVRVARHK